MCWNSLGSSSQSQLPPLMRHPRRNDANSGSNQQQNYRHSANLAGTYGQPSESYRAYAALRTANQNAADDDGAIEGDVDARSYHDAGAGNFGSAGHLQMSGNMPQQHLQRQAFCHQSTVLSGNFVDRAGNRACSGDRSNSAGSTAAARCSAPKRFCPETTRPVPSTSGFSSQPYHSYAAPNSARCFAASRQCSRFEPSSAFEVGSAPQDSLIYSPGGQRVPQQVAASLYEGGCNDRYADDDSGAAVCNGHPATSQRGSAVASVGRGHPGSSLEQLEQQRPASSASRPPSFGRSTQVELYRSSFYEPPPDEGHSRAEYPTTISRNKVPAAGRELKQGGYGDAPDVRHTGQTRLPSTAKAVSTQPDRNLTTSKGSVNKGKSTKSSLQKPEDRGLLVLSCTVESMQLWAVYQGRLELLFEIFGKLQKPVMTTSIATQEFVIKGARSSVTCVFYTMDRLLPDIAVGALVRCIGRLQNDNRVQCLSLRPATPEEQKLGVQLVKQCNKVMQELVADIREV